MSANLTIRQAQMVLPDRVVTGDLVIENGIIVEVAPRAARPVGEEIHADGLVLLPGLIDGQVHLGEPETETFLTGTRAAAAGGFTSILEMPRYTNGSDGLSTLLERRELAQTSAIVHYGMYVLGTPDNIDKIHPSDGTCGVVIHPSNIGMLELGEKQLEDCLMRARVPVHFVAVDPKRLQERHLLYPLTRNLADHHKIYDPRTASDALAVAIAVALSHGIPLHVLQVSSEEELHLLARHENPLISCSVSLFHLLFNDQTAASQCGDRAHTVPPIRSERHQHALLTGVLDGQVQCLTSGHCPTALERKSAPYPDSEPGIPSIEWCLPLCLDLVNQGKMSLLDIQRLWCIGPSKWHNIKRKGRLEVGYDGDIVLVDLKASKTIHPQTTFTKCGWSPWEGKTVDGSVVLTAVLGQPVYRDGDVCNIAAGKALHYAT